MKRQKKALFIITAAAAMTAGFTATALAGSWTMEGGGRKYKNDDGSFLSGGWNWIDSDGDGLAERYYFDENGLVLTHTTIEACELNGIGAWIKDGIVQTKPVGSGGNDGGTGNPGTAGGEDEPFHNGNTVGGYWGMEGVSNGINWDAWDPNWYDSIPELTEGEKAYFHYETYYMSYDLRTEELYQKVEEQEDRIYANPGPETAAKEMVWVEIPVWRLRNGEKVADTTRVQVLAAVADQVKTIFTEIYNGPEKFPIESIGGYAWRGNGLGSYHSSGLAIDINPTQNPQVRADGTVLVGNKWEPGVNPYSISRDSDVLKAFGKYGWRWGAAFNTKDYMHFEF